MRELIKHFIKDCRGATAIEYALICSLIFLGIVSAVQMFSASNSAMYNKIATNLK